MNMRKCIITVILFATSTFGIEPSELVRLYRGSLTNDVVSRELTELVTKRRDLVSEAMSRMNGLELMLMYGVIDSVSVTSTNLIIMLRDFAGNNEALILTPDKETSVAGHHHGGLFFTPVSLKNKGTGFRVTHTFNARSFGDGVKQNTGYIALSDKPTEVNEKDVEMIMEKGEWKTVKEYHAIVERENRLHDLWSEHIHKRREANELLQGEELTNRLAAIEHEMKLERDRIESGEQAEVVCPASRHLWLYALIPLCLLALLWVVKKKRKRDSP